MNKLSVRAMFLLVALSFFAVGLAYGDTIVTFPSDTSFSCNTNACDFMGNMNHQSEPLFTTGDFVSETFFTGQDAIQSLTYDFFLINNLGGNAGHSYANDVYINGSLVGSFLVPDCGSCGTQQEYAGTFNFAPLQGDGAYSLSIVLGETVPGGDGNETFLSPGSATLGDVPEPSSFILLGSGAMGLAGVIRRKLLP
jgi:hypothetical protein